VRTGFGVRFNYWAKKAGAVAYLQKPIDDQALLDATQWALRRQD